MRILIISQYYAPESFSAGTYLRELAEFLVKGGHDVTVETAFPHYPEGRVWKSYRRKLHSAECLNGVNIRRSFILAIPREWPIAVRALAPLTFSFSTFWSTLFTGRYDVIYTLYPILPLAIASLALARIKRCPIVFGVKDLSIEGLAQAGKLKRGLLQRMLEKLECGLYRRADAVQVPTGNQRHYLLQRGLPESRIEVIPDWADPDAIVPAVKNNRFREELNLGNKFLIIYSGNIGYASALEALIGAAIILRDDSSVGFVIIGGGAKLQDLEAKASEAHANNILFLPFQPRERFAEALAAADMCVITLSRQFTHVASQGKIYSIMSAARPILALMEIGAWGAVWIADHGIGTRVDPDDRDGVIAAIEYWKGHPAELASAGQRARSLLLNNYTVAACGELFRDLFDRVRRTEADRPRPCGRMRRATEFQPDGGGDH